MSWGPNANNPDNRVMPKWARGSNYPLGPLLYVCGHLCAVGTEAYGCKPGGEKPVLSDLARKDMVEVFFPCQECEDSRAWVWEKGVRKWVANDINLGSVARAPRAAVVGAGAASVARAAAPVVAGAPAPVAMAPVVMAAPVVATAAPVVVGASAAVAGAPVVTAAPVAGASAPVVVATAPQQQQQQLEKHMQLAREIEQLELEKKQLEEELQKVVLSSSK